MFLKLCLSTYLVTKRSTELSLHKTWVASCFDDDLAELHTPSLLQLEFAPSSKPPTLQIPLGKARTKTLSASESPRGMVLENFLVQDLEKNGVEAPYQVGLVQRASDVLLADSRPYLRLARVTPQRQRSQATLLISLWASLTLAMSSGQSAQRSLCATSALLRQDHQYAAYQLRGPDGLVKLVGLGARHCSKEATEAMSEADANKLRNQVTVQIESFCLQLWLCVKTLGLPSRACLLIAQYWAGARLEGCRKTAKDTSCCGKSGRCRISRLV